MKMFSKIMMSIMMLQAFVIHGQIGLEDKETLLEVSDLSSIHNDTEYDPVAFNYNEYEEVNLVDFSKTYQLDDVKKYTLFAVFSQSGAKDIFSINSDRSEVKISNDFVEGRQKVSVDIDDIHSHLLLYSGSSGKKSKNDIIPSMKLGSSEDIGSGTINIAEVLIFKSILDKMEIKKQESFLAIKYGISLPQDSTYVNMNGEVIYEPSANIGYNERVIALASDHKLKVSQATHNRDHFFRIGIDNIDPVQKNKKMSIENGSYLFIGDNGGSLEFNEDQLKRKWKLSSNSSSYSQKNYTLKFPVSEIKNFNPFYEYFFYRSAHNSFDDTRDDKSYRLSQIGDYLVSSDIKILDEDVQYVTIIRRPKVRESNGKLSLTTNNLQVKNGYITVSINSTLPSIEGELYLYNVDGYMLSHRSIISNGTYTQSFTFDSAGIYFVSFVSGNEVFTEKIIIQ